MTKNIFFCVFILRNSARMYIEQTSKISKNKKLVKKEERLKGGADSSSKYY